MNKIRKKKIFFISGSRSEYGQFSFLLKKLSITKKINFKLIITGMHLYEKFGNTYEEAIIDFDKTMAYFWDVFNSLW